MAGLTSSASACVVSRALVLFVGRRSCYRIGRLLVVRRPSAGCCACSLAASCKKRMKLLIGILVSVATCLKTIMVCRMLSTKWRKKRQSIGWQLRPLRLLPAARTESSFGFPSSSLSYGSTAVRFCKRVQARIRRAIWQSSHGRGNQGNIRLITFVVPSLRPPARIAAVQIGCEIVLFANARAH